MTFENHDFIASYISDVFYFLQLFQSLVEADDRFEVTHPVTMGLVCFRLKGMPILLKI